MDFDEFEDNHEDFTQRHNHNHNHNHHHNHHHHLSGRNTCGTHGGGFIENRFFGKSRRQQKVVMAKKSNIMVSMIS